MDHEPPHVKVFMELFKHIGIAFLLIGGISCLLEIPHWQEYFKQRLADVVVEQKYLEKMDVKQIEDLQLRTWKRLFKGAEIDREGSFLGHFEEKLKTLIGSPYRENVNETMIIDYCGEDDDCFIYTTLARYHCRQVRGELQEKVTWAPAPNELVEVEYVEITLAIPSSTTNPGPAIQDQPDVTTDNRVYTFNHQRLLDSYRDPPERRHAAAPVKDESDPLARIRAWFRALSERQGGPDPEAVQPDKPASKPQSDDEANINFSVPLAAFNEYDNLLVTVKAKCKIRKSGFIGWGMAAATRRFKLVFKHPDDMKVRCENFGIEDADVRKDEFPDHLELECTTWVLSTAGVAIELIPSQRSALDKPVGK